MTSFKEAVENASLGPAYKQGKQAIAGKDKVKIQVSSPCKPAGSINLDDHYKSAEPQAPRWDYGVGIKRSHGKETAFWVEVHPATSNQDAKDVLKKHQWLSAKLAKAPFKDLRQMTEGFIWVSTSGFKLNKGSKIMKDLARVGITSPRAVAKLH